MRRLVHVPKYVQIRAKSRDEQMPLPLIPIAIGFASVAAVGIASVKVKKDKERYNARRKTYAHRHESYRDFVEELNGNIDDLSQQRVDAQETLREAAKFLVRANVKDRDYDAALKISPHGFEELKQDIEISMIKLATSLGGGVVSGAVTGAAAVGGAYRIVGLFASASTGTAIRSLSGIAARNATLAWLGGGTLASGGGGIAAGAALLSRIGFAPLAAVPVVVAWVKAYRLGKRVDEEIAKMDVSEAEVGSHMAKLDALLARVREISESINNVEQALKDVLRSASTDLIEDVYRVAGAAKALAELLDVKMLPCMDDEKDLGTTGTGVSQ